ncbi:MAG TPA: hypothetical protein VKR55_03455 [Bradyrhizobium sp.]|uniref:hypothetical protein n=1 Tax=Bradyrhizobium sp. TaxID=376 RepID=UPI002D0CC021|nr:hypothetical protein [Bradyrhizobium sp.]HLZ01190.1 hypothetical protein [Bradyrhizobium sp.]
MPSCEISEAGGGRIVRAEETLIVLHGNLKQRPICQPIELLLEFRQSEIPSHPGQYVTSAML